MGIDTSIHHMPEMFFPLSEHASKELFRQCCRPSVPLPRQRGDNTITCVSRGRRCFLHLGQMDPVISFSEGHRSGMLLNLSGLTREERVIIQASTGKHDQPNVHQSSHHSAPTLTSPQQLSETSEKTPMTTTMTMT